MLSAELTRENQKALVDYYELLVMQQVDRIAELERELHAAELRIQACLHWRVTPSEVMN